MAPASTLAYGTVVGQFLVSASDSTDADALPDAVPASGTVTFTPSAGVVLDYSTEPNPSAILRKPIVATLDAEGYLTGPNGVRGVQLIATDNPTVKPVGWTWVATYALTDAEGTPLRTLTTHPFFVPSDLITDLIVAMPIEESKGVFLSKGDKGDLTTITIGSVSVGTPSVSVTEVGPESQLSFVLPVNNLQIGEVTTSTSTPGIVGPQGPVGPQGNPGGIVLGTTLGTTDLNTIVSSGIYRQDNSGNSTLARNYPKDAEAGVLVVLERIAGTNVIQTWESVSNSGNVTYRRMLSGGIWSSWKARGYSRVDQTAGRVTYLWDDVNNREQRIFGDTGWRTVAVTPVAGKVISGNVRYRRRGDQVELTFVDVLLDTGSSGYCEIIPSTEIPIGFRPHATSRNQQAIAQNNNAINQQWITNFGTVSWSHATNAGTYSATRPSSVLMGSIYWTTDENWPATLPGTAHGVIPNL